MRLITPVTAPVVSPIISANLPRVDRTRRGEDVYALQIGQVHPAALRDRLQEQHRPRRAPAVLHLELPKQLLAISFPTCSLTTSAVQLILYLTYLLR